MKAHATALLSGLSFAFGLGVSGMTRPEKVLGFLDLAGDSDPSLAFVMAGAVGVYLVLVRLVLRRRSPLFATTFSLPTRRSVDGKLVLGAAVFGAGWGLGGMCPGPALTDLLTGAWQPIVFVAAMLGGMLVHEAIERRSARASSNEPGAPARGIPATDDA